MGYGSNVTVCRVLPPGRTLFARSNKRADRDALSGYAGRELDESFAMEEV